MAIKDDIKTLLENSYELSRGEIIKKLNIDREQARKPITRLLEAKEIERRVDENGVEWFCILGGERVPTGSFERGIEVQFERAVAEYEQCVEASQGRETAQVHKEKAYIEGYGDGVNAGREEAWIEIECAIGAMIRKYLGIGEKA